MTNLFYLPLSLGTVNMLLYSPISRDPVIGHGEVISSNPITIRDILDTLLKLRYHEVCTFWWLWLVLLECFSQFWR